MDRNFIYTEVINMNIYEKLGRINILQRDSEDIFSDIGSIIDNKISDIISDSTVDFSNDDISIINSKLSFLINNLEEYKKIISGENDKDDKDNSEYCSCASCNTISLYFSRLSIKDLISLYSLTESTKLKVRAYDSSVFTGYDLMYIIYNDNNLNKLIILIQSKEKYKYHLYLSDDSDLEYNDYISLYNHFNSMQFKSEMNELNSGSCIVIYKK